DILDRLLHADIGLLGETDQSQQGDVVLDAPAYGAHGDDVAGQLELQRRVGTFPDYGEVDLGADGPPHDVHCLVQRHARDLGAVELDDEVVGEDAGARGGRVVDRGNDLDDALFHRHLDAEATELPGGV